MFKNNKKQLFQIILSVVFTFIFISFQNCGKVQFDGEDTSDSNKPASIHMESVTPSSSTSVPPLKLLFVIDNSASMKNSQQYLSQAVDSLINPLIERNEQGMQIHVQFLTTDDQGFMGGYKSISKNYYKKNGIKYYEGFSDIQSSVSVGDEVGTEMQYLVSQLDALTLQANAPTNKINNFKNHIKSKITTTGTNGSDTEKGLCSLLRGIFQNQTAFFKSGDTAGVVIISDETDSTTYQNCSVLEDKYTRTVTQISKQVSYNITAMQIETEVEYKYQSDGQWITSSTWILPKPTTQHTSGTCTSQEKSSRIQDFKSSHPDKTFLSIKNCNRTLRAYTARIYFQNHQLPSNYKNLCDQSFQYGSSSFANIKEYYKSRMYIPSGSSCSFISVSNYINPTNYTTKITPLKNLFPSIPTTTDIKAILKWKLNELFGNRYFISNIILTNSCTPQGNQSIGQAYIDLSQTLGVENTKIHPICSTDYTPAISPLSNFVDQTLSNTIYVELLEGQYITQVDLVRNGHTRTLNSNEYSLVGGTITLNFNVETTDEYQIYIATPQYLM